MRERGYPVENFEQRAADLSVDHGAVVDDYRWAHRTRVSMDEGAADTEQLREAMVRYRSLFRNLLGSDEGDEQGSAEVRRAG